MSRLLSYMALLALGSGIAVLFPERTNAQSKPAPARSPLPTPTPAPTPTPVAAPASSPVPVPGTITWSVDGQNLFIDQQTHGPGMTPPEGPAFVQGSPLSPNTPYDVWSSAPQIPGLAGILQYQVTPTYHGKKFSASLDMGAGFVTGSVTNAAYWGEDLFPTLNPHLGSTALPYRVVFPTNVSGDQGEAFRASVLGGTVGANDGSWIARAGYFNVAQTNRHIFIEPTYTNVSPSLAVTPAESLANATPGLSWWPSPDAGLPLLGLDLQAHTGLANFEFTNAALPALPGTSARITMGSVFIDHGEGTRYSAQVLHMWSGGAPIETTTLYGSDATLSTGPQGALPTSTLGGQQSTMAGLSTSFHAGKAIDAQIDVGRQWYNAQDVIEPGTQKPGGYYRAGLMYKKNRTTAAIDFYRFEPRYATMILPYGIPENIWSAAFAWPGNWLKSNYQINDNTTMGVNREGYRLRYFVDGGPFEWRLQYTANRQVDPATISNMNQTGFVDGFFLPQVDAYATIGKQYQYATSLAWHPSFGTLALDFVIDEEHRPAFAQAPADLVNYEAPQTTFSYSRQASKNVVLVGGFGYYQMKGVWATTPLDYGESTIFAGTEVQESQILGVFVQYRHNNFQGLPVSIAPLSPAFGANTVIVEQRVHF